MISDSRNRWILIGAIISLIASIAILAIKTYAYYLTGSVAVLSDALESIVNVITASLALGVIRFAAEPADREHPYGHGKMEYFSAAFEGGLITFAALAIGFEAGQALIQGRTPHALEAGALWVTLATSLNFVVGGYLLYLAKAHRTEALRASGHHLMSDVMTSVGALIGLGLVYLTGLGWLDPLMGLVIAGQLGYIGYGLVRNAVGALIDAADMNVLRELAQALQKIDMAGAIDFHQVRLIRSGHFHHVDAHVVFPEFWSVRESHHVALELEKNVREQYPYDVEIAFHIDPCLQNYCKNCSLENCSIRKAPFQEKLTWTPESLIEGPPEEE